MAQQLLLHGLDSEQSFLVVWQLLFSPSLRDQMGASVCLRWCEKLVDIHLSGKPEQFIDEYNRMAIHAAGILQGIPRPSLARPPQAMISLDMRIGLIPWVTPRFGEFLRALLFAGMAFEKALGDVLPVAFVLHGGPGDTKDNAIRITAPTGAVRASAEHWLMRAYLWRLEYLLHATLSPDEDGRMFSMHRYIDRDRVEKNIYFETTHAFGREEEDFLDFLRQLRGEKPTAHTTDPARRTKSS